MICHTRKAAAWLAEKMSRDSHSVAAVLSGDLTVEQRIAVLDRFRDGVERLLISTNVLARGIDVEQVTLVVNFDLPVDMRRNADCDTYLHRIGMTGLAIDLVDGPESMAVLKQIEDHFGKKIGHLNAEDVDELEKLED
jgi:ATP-dependent RNA helicase DDX19/DBP5